MGRTWVWICTLIFDFIRYWFASFPWRRLACGIPFFLVFLLLSVGYYLLEAGDTGLRNRLLRRQLHNALAKDDWETARVVLHRQLRIAPGNREAQFQLARALYATDERDQAVQLMHQLTFGAPDAGSDEGPEEGSEKGPDAAPESEADPEQSAEKEPAPSTFSQDLTRFHGADLRAGQWMVEKVFLPQPWEQLTVDEKQEFLSLLKWLYHSLPDQLSVKQLYADHLLKAERYREALPVLVALIPEAPGIGLRAAIVARSLDQKDRAREYAQHSLEQFRILASQDPSNASVAIALASCQVFLERHPEAIWTLQSAMERCPPQRPMLSDTLAGALVAWATTLQSKPEQTPQEQLQILKNLQLALQYAPNDERVIQLVANQILTASGVDDPQVTSLRESLIHGTSPGISHFIRGTAAVLAGNDEDGEFHLAIAAKTLPDSDVILNNLAYVMARQDDADLEQALQISETAISQASPPTPYHLETRGQILFKLGRYADAVPDLEAGLAVPALATAAHRSLAECYQHLGAEDLSKQHRIAAEEAESNVPTS